MRLPFPHQCDVPLNSLTTLGIGGPSRYLTEASTIDQMCERLAFCHAEGIPFVLLGKGSNSLFDDRGFAGLVILNKIDTFEIEGSRFRVGGGYSLPRLGQKVARLGFGGLEFAPGIPASVGGAIFMNAGAGGQEISDHLKNVTFVNAKGEVEYFERASLAFGYRTSSFQKMAGAIVEGVFELPEDVGAKGRQKEILDYRLATQPYGERSAGCAFRNPDCAAAGQLIESCGLKGLRVGDAEVSRQHANFIINRGDAKATDVLELVAQIQKRLKDEKEVHLQQEIRYIPYDV